MSETVAVEEPKIENGEAVIPEIQVVESSLMEMSPTIGKLALALSKAQGAMTAVGKGKTGYGYVYADLASVIDVAKKPLSDNEIAVTQGHYLKKGKNPSVVTQSMLMHSSGEWVRVSLEIPLTIMKGLSPAQSVGVVCTYAKRYLMQAQLGLASEDTDAALKK